MNKIRYLIGALALAVLGAGPALAATEATSSAFTLYTISGTSRSLTSPVASGAVKPVTYKAGDKVTVTNPRTGAVSYLAGSASAGSSSAGSVSWTPDAGVGGSWTLTRTPSSGSAETATFTVSTPAGTTADPIGVYSTSDLANVKASGKYYKFLASSGSLAAPAGWTLYYNSSSKLYWLYQWPAVGTGSYTAASPKVINAASALTTAGYYTLYGDYKVSAPSGYSSYSVGSGKITSISTATNGSTLYRKGTSEDYWLYLWPTTGSGTAASPYIINSQSSLTSNGSYYAFYGDSLASVPSGYTKANSSGTPVTSVTAPAGWTLYRNSASTIFYLYQWRAAGYGAKTISSPLVVDNSTISSEAKDGLYYTPYGGVTAEIFGDTVSGYTTVYSMGSGSVTSITVPSGYKSYVAGDGIFWLNSSAHTTGGSATSFSGNGTAEATASGFHLHTATVTSGATSRTLSSVSELYPLAYKANTPINVTAPVSGTLMAAQSSDGVYNWTPDSLGTWTLSHVIDGTTYNATFVLGDAAASSGYWLITWKQDASTVIDSTYVAKGTVPTHADPEREADDTYVYAFNGWTPTVVAATADASYTAQWTTTPVVAKVGSARYTSFAAARTAAGTTGSNTIVMRKNDTTATTLTVGQILKVDNTAATYSGTVSASGTNVKIVTSTSGKVTTYTCKYDLSKATITVSGSYTYTGSAITPTYTVTHNGTTLTKNTHFTETLSNNTAAGSSATITVTGKSGTDYDGTASKTFTIGTAGLTVTAKAKSIVYGAAPANDGVTYTGFVGSDSVSSLGGTLAYDYSYSQYGNIGSYTITPKGLTSSNYAITFAAGTLTVTAKPVALTWSNTSLTYNGSSQKPTAAIPSGALVNNDAVTVSVAGEKKDAGSNYTATATLSGAKAGNYLLSNATQAFSIGKAGLTVTADNKSVTYGDAAPAYTVTYSGWKTGDSASVLTAAATATSAYTATTKPGTYDITASGAAAANYTFSYVKGTLTVGKAPLTATGSSHTVKYGAAAPAYSVSYTGWRNGDGDGKLSAAPTATSSYTTTSPVGEYAVTVSGGASDWYTISYVSGKVTVEKADAAANVVANSGLVYSGEAQALVTASGVTGGTISYSVDSGDYGASATGVLPKSYTVAWKVTGDSNHADKTGSVSVSISGSVPGERTIKLNDGVTVAIPAGVTVTVDTDLTAEVPAGKTVTVAVASSGVRAEVTGTAAVSAAGGIALSGGDAVYLYSNQNDIDSISRLTVPAINGSKLKIKAVE